MNQNYVTNRKIKEAVDKNQKGYEEPSEETAEPKIYNNSYDVIASEADYNRVLADKDSGLNRYYAQYPREDGIDKDGNPVTDPETEVVGHSFASAMVQPTDPAKTSTYPWIVLALDNFKGTAEFKYDGETKFTKTWETPRTYAIISVPNKLGMTDYRLEWGTGNPGEKTFNPELLEITFTPLEE